MAGCVTDSETVDLSVSGGVLEADVIVSSDAGNQLSIHSNGLFASGAPTGSMLAFAGAAPPAGGWLICDGSPVSRTTYAALFALIGSIYGGGDGSTTFNLPDGRGRTMVGVGTHADVSSLGETEGLGVGSRTPKHDTTVHDPGHAHGGWTTGANITVDAETGTAPGAGGFTVHDAGDDGTTAEHQHQIPTGGTSITAGVQSGARPVDSPAYIALNWIIKT